MQGVTKAEGGAKPAGKGCLSFFFLVFLAAGLFFAVALVRDVYRTAQSRVWSPTECTIMESAVLPPSDDEGRYVFGVRYSYQFDGRRYESREYAARPKTSEDYSDIQRLVDAYPPEAQVTCFVNPKNPSQAVLKHGSLLLALLLPLPLIFAAIGGLGIYFTWRPPATRGETTAMSDASKRHAREPRGFAAAILAVFFLIGAGMAYPFIVRPLQMFIDAANWRETPCVVVSSDVRSSSDSDGTTYLADILYRYRFDGREYQSNRIGVLRIWSSGYRGKAELVARYPAGAETTCFVNPNDPRDALLDRSLQPSMLFALLPLAFMAVGGWGFAYFARKPRHLRQNETVADTGSRVLRTKRSRVGGFVALFLGTLFWNGIVAVFVWQVAREWQSGRTPWLLTLFLVPFVGVGLLLISGLVTSFLGLFNPRLRLVLAPGAVSLGESAQLEWQVNGGTPRFEHFRLFLEGREEADYRRGTDSYTDKSRFAEIGLVDTSSRLEMRSGHVHVQVPADLVPTFTSANNRIIWSLHAEGRLRFWPDVKEEFEIAVLPPRR